MKKKLLNYFVLCALVALTSIDTSVAGSEIESFSMTSTGSCSLTVGDCEQVVKDIQQANFGEAQAVCGHRQVKRISDFQSHTMSSGGGFAYLVTVSVTASYKCSNQLR